MRSLAFTLMFGCSLLPAGCTDDGGGSASQTSNGPATSVSTTSNGTGTGTGTGTGSGVTTSDGSATAATTPTEATMGGSGSDSNETLTGTGTTAVTTIDTTTGPITTDTMGMSSTSGDTTTGSSSTTMAIDTSTSTTGTSTTTTGDSTSTSGSTTMDVPCQVVQATLKPVVPNMMLVLDKSGSMVVNPGGYWDHDNDPNTAKITRWNSLYSVVDLVVTKFNDKLNFGANLFPSKFATGAYDANACKVNANVEIPVAAKNGPNILAGIPGPMDVSLKGGTPTSAGMIAALKHLKTLPADVPRAVLLVTDGAANCTMGAPVPGLFEAYDNNVHTIVSDAYTVDKIPTYVVGIDTKNVVSPKVADGNPDETNTYVKLNELATQGGKPKNDPNEKFYNATNQIQLAAALDAIIADALSCVIPLDMEPAKPELTKVKVLGADVPKVMDCDKENGWVYTNPNGPYDAIELCGTACTNLKQSGKAEVNFFCVPN